MKRKTIMVIHNPIAGKKRNIITFKPIPSIKDIQKYFNQYHLEADFFSTAYKFQGVELAKKAIDWGYQTVVAAGGDGTINEVIQGIVNTNITLGIIPIGSSMNIARMLSIPYDLEKAVSTLKIRRTRDIDLGKVIYISGKELNPAFYFIEASGVGIDAWVQKDFTEVENGDVLKIFTLIRNYINFYAKPVKVVIDDNSYLFTSTMINISNGPYTGVSLETSPEAKLNDHQLSITFYRMSQYELVRYFLHPASFVRHPNNRNKILMYKGKKVVVTSKYHSMVHADATLFGTTPVAYEVVPNALKVICGFPKDGEDLALEKRAPSW